MSSEVLIQKIRCEAKSGTKKKYTDQEIESKIINANVERQFNFKSFIPKPIEKCLVSEEILEKIVTEMVETGEYNKKFYAKKYKNNPKDIDIYTKYIELVKANRLSTNFAPNIDFENVYRSTRNRIESGVLVFTLVMSDRPFKIINGVKKVQKFTCKHNCYYCPAEPNMARSYLSTEPAVRRGDSFNWDPVAQIFNRVKAYIASGQISPILPSIIKGEFILEGGTYSAYPIEYREWFMNMIYYACNTVYDDIRRDPFSLLEEMKINETCLGIRVIGLSIETRPDDITADDLNFIKHLRLLGVTKVQIGVQHIDDDILYYVNRNCTTKQVKEAMKILLNNGFKIQIHLMPDLPGSNQEKDIKMFDEIFREEDFGFDHLKVYPTMIVNFTVIKTWYENGTYKPYGDDNKEILSVLIEMTKLLQKYERYDIRKERIIRDIPKIEITGGTNDISMGDTLSKMCKIKNIECPCIRCREIKSNDYDENDMELIERVRNMCDSKEIFLSFETKNRKKIYGFLRLRLKINNEFIFSEELKDCAIIRELHIYGTASTVNKEVSRNINIQNKGLGKKLVERAKEICKQNNYKKLAVISGNGVKEYYKNKHNFVDHQYYMICDL